MDVIFADNRNPAVLFSRIIFCYQPLSSICIVIVLKNFEDLVFVDDKLTTKQQKLRPSKIYTYTVHAKMENKLLLNSWIFIYVVW